MRKLVLTMAAVAALCAGGLATVPQAEALPASGNIAVPAEEGLLQDAAYVCNRIWRCGRYGCGWRRACYGAPGYYGYGYGYGHGYRYRHYGWGHRHYRHW